MNRFPTRRALVVAGAGLLLVLAGITAQAGWLFVLAAGALGLVAGSLAVRHRLGSVEVARNLPQRVRVGDEVGAGFTLRNRSTASVPMFVLTDELDGFEPVSVASERIPGNAATRVELVRTARRRGVFTDGVVTLTSGAPFGLARSRRREAVPTHLTVVPRWVELRSFPLLDPSANATEDPQERPMSGLGHDYMGIRDYRAGDPLRTIHWRSTARAAKLIVREYEREVSARIGLVLAGADHGEGPESSFETLVSAAASIGIHALNAGHSIYVARPSDDGVESLPEPTINGLLGWLAAGRPVDAPLDDVVRRVRHAVGDAGTVIVVASNAGSTGGSIASALGAVSRTGGRTVLVAADAETWDRKCNSGFDGSMHVAADAVRWLYADEDLAKCLG